MLDINTINALFLLVRFCACQADCMTCPLRAYCGKQIQEW